MQERAVIPLHDEQDTLRNKTRMHRALVLFGVIAAVALALIVASLIWRDASHMNNPNETPSQIITIVITLVAGCIIIFLWGMKMTPLLSYRRYLKEINSGLTRDIEGVVVEVDADTTFREGLGYYGMIVNIGDLNEPEDERRLYWDGQLGKPQVAVGDHVYFRAHGNDIIGVEKR